MHIVGCKNCNKANNEWMIQNILWFVEKLTPNRIGGFNIFEVACEEY